MWILVPQVSCELFKCFLQELEAERLKLIEDVTANKRKMQELEDNLLYKLSSTKGTSVIVVGSCQFLGNL